MKAQGEALAKKKEKASPVSKNPWERVLSHIDTKEGGYKGAKDITRMKAVMGGRKEDFEKGAAKFE